MFKHETTGKTYDFLQANWGVIERCSAKETGISQERVHAIIRYVYEMTEVYAR